MDTQDILKELSGKTMITLTDFFTGAAIGLNADDIKASAYKVSDMPQRGGNMLDYMGHTEKFRNASNRESLRPDDINGAISNMKFFLHDYMKTPYLEEREKIILEPMINNYQTDTMQKAIELLRYHDRLETRLRDSDAMCSSVKVEGEHHARYVHESPEEIYEKAIEAKAQTMARALKIAGLEK